MRRMSYLLLLLLIVAGNSMLGVHAATHLPADANECKLCAAYADPSDAIPTAEISMPSCSAFLHAPEFSDAVATVSAVFEFRQRGPPLSI